MLYNRTFLWCASVFLLPYVPSVVKGCLSYDCVRSLPFLLALIVGAMKYKDFAVGVCTCRFTSKSPFKWLLDFTDIHAFVLKLYCRYEYTKPYMINRIWSLKQLWLKVNDHAWFNLHGLRWPVRNEKGAKNSKWKYMFPAGFEPTPRQSMTGKSAH